MMIMMIKPHFRSWWALLTCLLSDHRECRVSAFHLRYWPTLCVIAWEVERQCDCVGGWQATWLRERLTGNVTAWVVDRQRDCVSGWQATWLRERLTGNVTAWAVERHAAWLREWLTGNVTAWVVDRQRDCVSGWKACSVTAWVVERQRYFMGGWQATWLRELFARERLFKTHQSLLCRIVLAVNQTWRPVLCLFTRKRICDILKLLTWLGQPLALYQITGKKYNILKEKKSVWRL